MKKTLATTEQTPAVANEIAPEIMEKVLIGADLSGLNPAQRLEYYKALCLSLELNPLTRPFEYMSLDGKTVLYARKDCTDQIRKRDGVQITVASRELIEGLYIVTAQGKNSAGREDESIGVEAMVEPEYVKEWDKQQGKKVWVANSLAGKPLPAAERANAMMKAETKAKRRVTLSLGGLGMSDESEIESIMSEEPRKEMDAARQIEEKREAAAGHVVETFGTKEEKPEVVSTSKPWREVECHIGNANGPWLGVKLGDMVPPVIESLSRKFLPGPKLSKKDKALAEALQSAIAEGADKERPEASPEPAKPETTTDTPAKPEKPARVAKSATKEASGVEPPAKEALEAKPIEWKSVVIHIPNKKCEGKTLGEVDTATLRAVHNQLLPKIADSEAVKDRVFRNAVRAGCKETGCLLEGHEELDEPKLRKAIVDSFACLGVEETAANKLMFDSGTFAEGATLESVDEKMLRYLAANWPLVIETVEKGDK